MNSARLPRTPRARSRTRERPKSRRRAPFVLIGAVLLLGVSTWLIWFSGVFIVDAFDVPESSEGEAVGGVIDTLAERTLGQNLLFLDTQALSDEIAGMIPELKTVHIGKVWPRTLKIILEHREPLGVWCRSKSPAQECYLFDHDAVWGSGIPSSGTILLSVMDEHAEGAPYRELVDEVLLLVERLRKLNLSVSRVALPEGPLDEVHVYTTDGYPIFFARHGALDEQLDVFEVFLIDKRAQGDFVPLQIDARVPGKIYFK